MFIRKLFNRVEDIFTKRNDPLIWSRELERHYAGSYSYACVRARPGPQLEFSHVELGSRATFIGIYDGHNGPEAALHAYQNLFDHLIDNILEQRLIHQLWMTQAVDAMENQIIAHSRADITKKFSTVGSCCLIVLIYRDQLWVRNLGDGKCVLGRKLGSTIIPDQVNEVDNLENEPARLQFLRQHREPGAITVNRLGRYSVKDKVQVTKSLGDAFLKHDDCAVDDAPDLARFHIPGPRSRPYLTAQVQDPTRTTRFLGRPEKFVIIASNGLWDFLSNEEATRIVETHPKQGIARILIQEAQKVAARRNNYAYINLQYNTNNRNEVHDDMTVVVVFLNSKKLVRRNDAIPRVSVRAFSEANQNSRFADIDEIMRP